MIKINIYRSNYPHGGSSGRTLLKSIEINESGANLNKTKAKNIIQRYFPEYGSVFIIRKTETGFESSRSFEEINSTGHMSWEYIEIKCWE